MVSPSTSSPWCRGTWVMRQKNHFLKVSKDFFYLHLSVISLLLGHTFSHSVKSPATSTLFTACGHNVNIWREFGWNASRFQEYYSFRWNLFTHVPIWPMHLICIRYQDGRFYLTCPPLQKKANTLHPQVQGAAWSENWCTVHTPLFKTTNLVCLSKVRVRARPHIYPWTRSRMYPVLP